MRLDIYINSKNQNIKSDTIKIIEKLWKEWLIIVKRKIGLRDMFPISYNKYLELQEELKNHPPIGGFY